MIVFGTPLSTYTRKVLFALREKGLAYESRPVMPQGDDADFRKASPVGKVPAIQDGDYRLADSSAILAYLDRKHPETPLYPTDAKAFGTAVWYDEYADTVLAPAVGKYMMHAVFKPKFFGQEGDKALIEEALTKDIPNCFTYLESVVPAAGFLMGDRFGVADIAVMAHLTNFLMIGGQLVDAARFPKFAAYAARLQAHPSIAAELQSVGATLKAMAK